MEITSPVKRFPGTVVLPDALTWPQYLAWTKALEEAQELGGNEAAFKILGGILACVAEWKISGIPEHPTLETFPATPPGSVSRLISFVMNSISEMMADADESPN